jgi:SAM-dependent methyltransferase
MPGIEEGWAMHNRESMSTAGTNLKCPVCREQKRFARFERRKGLDYEHELWMCLECHAVLNYDDLSAATSEGNFREAQSQASRNFYTVDEEALKSLQVIVESNKGIHRFLLEQCPDLGRRTSLDFGAGRGCLASAATDFFDRSFAVELNLQTLEQTKPFLPNNDRITIAGDVDSLKQDFDVITSFHVLEHMPDMRDVLERVIPLLVPGGAFFFQVPLLRNDYLVRTHYTFLNEPSARFLCRELGLDVVGVWFDTAYDFLSCIGRRPQAGSLISATAS